MEYYFPIDSDGWVALGQESLKEDSAGIEHNFYFTTEIHATFTYHAGENHFFNLVQSDDDLWVFINDKLAIDIGGVHEPQDGGVNLDNVASYLGIVDGGTYPLDVFFAERRTKDSHIKIGTTIPDLRTVSADVRLVENTNFLTNDESATGMPMSFTIPENTEAISFQFSQLAFDLADPDSINDAFELALVDVNGLPLVPTIGLGRDSFFNFTEEEAPITARGATFVPESQTVVVDVRHVPAGAVAKLVARLVNNDGDTTTEVYIDEEVRFLERLDTGDTPYREIGGSVVVEAEYFTGNAVGVSSAADAYWQRESIEGAGGGYAVVASPNTGVNTAETTNGPRLDYRIDFTTPGVYYAWVRMKGASGDASVHVGLDGVLASGSGGLSDQSGNWHWEEEQATSGTRVTLEVATRGIHTLNLWMREDGVAVDQIALTRNSAFIPSLQAASTSAHSELLPLVESDGLIAVEAQNYSRSVMGGGAAPDHRWTQIPDSAASSGTAMRAAPDSNVDAYDAGEGISGGPRLDYEIDFTNAGTYYVWVRMKGTNSSGTVHVGLDGTLTSEDGGLVDMSGQWHWEEEQATTSARVTVSVPTPGLHTLNLWMGEDGAAVDKFVLTTDSQYIPVEVGPDETVRQAFASPPLSSPPRSTWGSIDYTRLTDVSTGFDVAYHRTSFNEETDVLYVEANLTNNSRFRLRTDQDPILVGVTNISKPFVSLHEPDGYTTEGVPFYDVTQLASGVGVDQRHDGGDTIDGVVLRFSNPNNVQFGYELVVLGAVNQAPAFETEPVTEVLIDNPSGYVYDSEAIDPDNDHVQYSVVEGPPGMDVDPLGIVTWSPLPTGDIGLPHPVTIRASDGELWVDQSYNVTIVDMPNRPPLFTTTPIVDAFAGIPYIYPADAFDADGDELTFAAPTRPSEPIDTETMFKIDGSTGQATWTPTVEQIGDSFPVTLTVTDGIATDTQTYQITVHPDPANRPPVITSQPRELFEFTDEFNPAAGDVQPDGFFIDLEQDAEHMDTVSITLPEFYAPKVDVFLLLDDTGSFRGIGPGLVEKFPEIVSELETTFGDDVDFGFGVGRFEDYSTFSGDPHIPFAMQMPITPIDAQSFAQDLNSALNTGTPGGGKGTATYLEALYQIATGAGFDGNGNADFSDYGDVLPQSSGLGGVAFRQGAVKIVLVATDTGTAYLPDGNETITGAVNPLTGEQTAVPVEELQGLLFREDTDFGGRNASFQQTVDALNGLDAGLGVMVIGLGAIPIKSADLIDDIAYSSRSTLEALATLTGAINTSTASIPNGIDGGDGYPADPIDQGDPYFFQIDLDDTQTIADGTVHAITNAILNPDVNIRLQAADSVVDIFPTVRPNVFGGVQTEFDVTFTGDGRAHSFDLQFVNDDTNLLLGSIPVTINYNYRYDVEAKDPDNDSVTFELVEKPAWASMPDQNTGIIAGKPDAAGTYHFKIRATDGKGGEDIQEFDLTVTMGDPNEDPVVQSIAPTEATAGITYHYAFDATDADQDDLTFLLLGDPPGDAPDELRIDADTGVITWTPKRADVGSQPVAVRVEDGRGGSAEHSFTIQVADSELPTVDPEFISDPIEVAVAGENYIYRARATDQDADDLTYHVASGPPGLSIVQQTGDVVWTPRESQIGQYVVVLRVDDGRRGVDFQVFDIEVVATNRAPRIISQPATIAAPADGFSYQLVADDPDGDVLTYYIDPVSDALNMAISSTGLLTWDSADIQLGDFRITATVADGRGGVDDQSFVLTVGSDAPPTITGPATLSATLNTTYSQPVASTASTLTLDALSESRGMSIVGGNLEWTPHRVGQFPVILTATENGIDTVESFTIRVLDTTVDQPPIVTSTPKRPAVADRTYLYTFSAYDPNGDAVSLEFVDDSELSPAPSFEPSTGLFSWTPAAGGNYQLVFRATAGGRSTTQTFSLPVLDNAPPQITSETTWPKAYQFTAGMPASLDAFSAFDPNGDEFQFRLEGAPDGLSILTNGGFDSWTPDTVGTYQFNVVAEETAADALSSVHPVIVRIVEDPGQPNESPQGEDVHKSIQAGRTFIQQVHATDGDDDPLTYTLAANPAPPAGLTLDNYGRLRWATTTDDITSYGAPHVFKVLVSDGRTSPTEVNFTLHVTRDPVPNFPAQIEGQPPYGAVINQLYEHDFEGFDPDGDSIFWYLDAAPDGADIDVDSGLLRWTPTSEQLGLQGFKVRVVDTNGQGEVLAYSVDVRSSNLPPRLEAAPATQLQEGVPFEFEIVASDPEGDPLKFIFGAGLPGAVGNQMQFVDGKLVWTPNADDLATGTHPLEIRVETPDEQFDTITTTLYVVAASGNDLPVFMTTPIFYGVAGEAYQYPAHADDNDPITYDFSVTPTALGMTINTSDGTLDWPNPVLGPYWVTVSAEDVNNAITTQRYLLQIVDANNTPTIELPDTINHPLGTDFNLDLRLYVNDADFDPLDYDVTIGGALPDGMVVNELGRISWAAESLTEASHTIDVTVTDPFGKTDTDSMTLVAASDNTDPVVGVTASTDLVYEGFPVTFFVEATDDVAVSSLTLHLLPPGTAPEDALVFPVGREGVVPITLSDLGDGTFGDYDVWAVAIDTADNPGSSDTISVRLADMQNEPPAVRIFSPTLDQVISEPVDVIGTIFDPSDPPDAITYTISLIPVDSSFPSEVIDLGTFSGERTDEPLGAVIDPTLLPNGSYLLRVEAHDNLSPTFGMDQRPITIDSQLKLGNFALSFTDMEIDFTGFPLSVTRQYDTLRAAQSGEFGYGWQLSLPDTRIQIENANPNDPFVDNTLLTITLPDGSTESFRFLPEQPSGWGAIANGSLRMATARFLPADLATTSTLTLVTRDGLPRELTQSNGTSDPYYYRLDSLSASARYNPAAFGDDYLLTTRTGVRLLIDSQTGDLLRIIDNNGNSVAFNGNQIINDSGDSNVAITLHYESGQAGSRRVRAVEGPDGSMVLYGYNPQGELVSVTNRAGGITQFNYEDPTRPHYLTEIIDPRGVSVLKLEFDPATGRVENIIDASGQGAELGYNLDLGDGLFLESISDAEGNPTELVRDSQGNTLRQIEHLLVNKVDERFTYLITLYEYDAQGNRTRESVPFTYDDPNTRIDYVPAEITWAQQSDYNETTGDLERIVDALGNETLFKDYDEFGNPREIVDPLGNSTFNFYDGKGNLIETRDAEGNITRFEYDRGLPTVVKQVVDGTEVEISTSHYNSLGLLEWVQDADGFRQNFSYNDFNEVTSSSYLWVDPDDAGNTKTVQTYTDRDDEGRVVGTRQLVDGVELWSTTTVYAAGLVAETIDRYGIKTENIYDARGNLIETRTQSTDAAGQPTWIVSRTVYDDNGRAVFTIDPHEDASPEDTFLAAPGTHTIYDSLGRVVETQRLDSIEIHVGDDGIGLPGSAAMNVGSVLSSSETFYDAVGRVDYTRQYDGTDYLLSKNVYDAVGRLEQSIQDLDDDLDTLADQLVTHYFHDAAGRQIRVQDALGNETRYVYDNVGRQVAVISPLVVDPDTGDFVYVRGETVYDEQGRRVQETENLKQATLDENAAVDDTMARTTDYEYEDGRLAAVVLPGVLDTDPASATYQQVVRPRYAYTYDIYGNQKSITDPKGRVTKFTYDELHRQTSRQLPEGVIAGDGSFTETMQYDALGQLELSIDFEGRHTAYGYDGLGRLASKAYFVDAAAYDNGNGTPAETVDYTNDALGRVIEIDDSNFASATTQDYDAFGRVEQIASPQGIINYGYDNVGRQTRTWTSTDAAGLSVVSHMRYAYDELGRLETVTVVERNDSPVSEQTTYRYDDVGNLNQVEHPGGVIADYDYDALHRLVLLRHFADDGDDLYEAGIDTLLAEFDYTVATDGKRSRVVETNDLGDVTTIDWLYDALGRLTEERYDAEGTASDFIARYAFDLASNRVLLEKDHGNADPNPLSFTADETVEYRYDSNDRLLDEVLDKDGTADDRNTVYTYDGTQQATKTEREGVVPESGDVVKATTYQYNVRGRLAQVTIDDGTSITVTQYQYNDDGARVEQTVTVDGGTSVVTAYHIDPQNATGHAKAIEEFVDGALERTYTFGHAVLSQAAAAGVVHLLSDGGGSTRVLVDGGTGQVAERYAYDAYGQALLGVGLTAADAAQTTWLFGGDGQYDPSSGLTNHLARWRQGAFFLTLDVYAGNGQDPLSLHKYLYAHANPVQFIDPSGLFSIVGSISVGSIGSIISEINVSAGQSVIDSLGIEGSIDFFGQATQWVWDHLPETVKDVISGAVSFVWDHVRETAIGATFATVAMTYFRATKSTLAGKIAKYTSNVASTLAPTKILRAAGRSKFATQGLVKAEMATIDLNGAWRQAGRRAGLRRSDSTVYIVRDTGSGELLKVGETGSWESRFSEYVRRARSEGRTLDVSVFRIETNVKLDRVAIERQMRLNLKDEGHLLPWDATIIGKQYSE